MPELPEVETVASGLRRSLRGKRVVGVREGFPGVYGAADGTGDPWPREIVGIRRRGKLILIDLDGDLVLAVHLRMTGHLSVATSATAPPPHTHVRILLDEAEELRFTDPRRFGRVSLETSASLARLPFVATLGPEPFELSEEGLAERLSGTRSAVKAALLDQRRIAGIGNIYADEILFDCGLHPAQPASTLLPREWGPLLASLRRILESAIARGGSTIRDYRSVDGSPGNFQAEHRVFGRTGEPCRACGQAIRKIRVAGRGTHFCPRCQPFRRRRGRRSPNRVRTRT